MEPPTGTPEPTPPEPSPAPPEPSSPGISQVPLSNNTAEPLPPPFTPGEAASPADPAPPGPIQPPPAGPQPPVTVGDGGIAPPSAQIFTPVAPSASGTSGRKLPLKLIIPAITVVILLIGAAIFYFGYYTNPAVIYAQSLSNTGKGYDRLVDYADKQAEAYNKGYTGSGSYKFESSGTSVDGKIAFKSAAGNSDTSFDIGANGIRVFTDIRTIKNDGATPDVYLKFSGIKGLGSAIGSKDWDPALAKLDGRWIIIDHTLIDKLNARSGQSQTAAPTREQVIDEARAFGEVNQRYLLSTAKDRAVTKIVKKVGTETVDGHKTYHYKVALRKENVRKYILAQRDALRNSKLNDWLKENHYDKDAYDSLTDSADSAKDIKDGATYDVWMDTSRRVLYKVRVGYDPNPAANYVDVGLDYKGGDDYPLFIAGKSKDESGGSATTYSLVADVNTKTDKTDFRLNARSDGPDAGTARAGLSFSPATSSQGIDKPAGAIPLIQALKILGLEDFLDPAVISATGSPVFVQLKSGLDGADAKNASAVMPQAELLRLLLRR